MSLLLCDDNVRFPNNRLQAKKEVYVFAKKNVKEPSIQEWLYEVYERNDAKQICRYLPHHGVYNKNNSGKIYIVFSLRAIACKNETKSSHQER